MVGTLQADREREIKLEVDDAFELPDLGRVTKTRVSHLPAQDLVTTYFDTPDFRLWQRGLTLRLRQGDTPGGGTWTLKVPERSRGPVLTRTELSWAGDQDAVPGEVTRVLRGVVRRTTLEEVARLAATRRRIAIQGAKGTPALEVDDDAVTVIGGRGFGRRFRQIEVELGPGKDRELRDALVRSLRRAGARPDHQPKLAKAGAIPESESTAELDRRAPLGRRTTVGDLVQRSLGAALAELLDHDYHLRLDPSDPPSFDVHQARVATRRLRSDLKTFRSVLDPVWLRHTRNELKWLGERLGAMRDADVLAFRLNGLGEDRPADAGGLAELHQALADRRAAASRELATAMESERYLDLIDRLHAAAQMPPFYDEPDADRRRARHRAGRLATTELPSLVRRPWRALKREVRHAGPHPSDSELHQIRIRAKQLRYAAEAAEPLVGRRARKLAGAAERVQTVLGEHHDSVAAEEWLRQEGYRSSPAGCFVAGRLSGEERRQQRRARRRWPRDWAALDDPDLVGWLR